MNNSPVNPRTVFTVPLAAVPIAPAAPAGPAPADISPAPDVSPELAPLRSLSMQQRYRSLVQRARQARVGGRDPQDPCDDDAVETDEPGKPKFSRMSPNQPSGDGEGSDSGKPASAPAPAQPESGFERAKEAGTASSSVHMALCAARLPERCAAFQQQHGDQDMLPFLRGEILELLPALVRDLGEKLAQRHAGGDIGGPVREVFSDFVDLMRPLYQRYAQWPLLLVDVRDVLCASEKSLAYEADERPGVHPRLLKVMHDTVFPLLPVLVLSHQVGPGRGTSAMVGVAA